ncbi:phosphoserine transaminase [Rubritalea marina]|uniref:phosphoserine transaminase n=1 Tax=Rubritalea marina TaxID=361055 RepID=UPI00037CF3A5|nr:phosphoserine transaminase [Rubritalea marina]
MSKPTTTPDRPYFSSGPCAKRPGYSLANLKTECLGRSHRSAIGKAVLQEAIDKTRKILNVPDDYLIGIVPASDTGAVEMILWHTLGGRAVDVCHWESFGKGWLTDITKQLKLPEVNEITADYGVLPDLTQVKPENDVVFTYNGTTSGVRVDNVDWISDEREGITICDATSAAFAMDLPWEKLDVTTYSWQKVLGGEGGHGMVILSPKAVARIESYKPDRPLPKIFRLLKGDSINAGIFRGETINTPSMLAVVDYIDALDWADSIGGLTGMIGRADANKAVIDKFVAERDWVSNLAVDPATASSTSVCLSLDLDADKVKAMVKLLAAEDAAYDIGAYRDAPAGLRIWCGATVNSEDLEALIPWLDWAYAEVQK